MNPPESHTAATIAGPGLAGRILAWVPSSVRAHRHWPRVERWVIKLGTFFLAQGLLQGLMALCGFFLLRWMEVRDYAIYTLVFSVQSAMITFGDVGFTNAIVPLVGQRVDDREVIGKYVAAARWLRLVLLPAVLVFGAVALAILGGRQGLGLVPGVTLYALAAAGVWFNATSALYGNPLLIRQDLGFMHSLQNGMAATRFAGYALGHLGAWFGSIYVFALTTALSIGQALLTRLRSARHFDEPSARSPVVAEARREMLRFIRPQVPILLFHALQGQIMIFIVSLAGNVTALASLGAVGRLGQIYAFSPYLCGWIMQPYFARVRTDQAQRRFFQILLATVAGLSVLPLVARVWPDPFLWLLGHNYHHLRHEVFLLFVASTFGITTAFIVTMCFARGWLRDDAVLWSGGTVVAAQVAAVMTHDVSTTAGTLNVIIWGSAAGFVAHLILALLGLRRELRRGSMK